MGHNIQAILLKGKYDEVQAANFDLYGVSLEFDLTLFFIDHYYSAYWQAILKTEGMLDINGVDYILYPCETALAVIVEKVSKSPNPVYAIISTDYFGGVGDQWANVYVNRDLADKSIIMINQALAYLGVEKRDELDEFDTIGLSKYRSNPDYLDKYADLADELGV